jgi:hypothetical protein
MCRQVSSWVGDHQRIPAVDCFFFAVDRMLCSGGTVLAVNKGDAQKQRMVSWPGTLR